MSIRFHCLIKKERKNNMEREKKIVKTFQFEDKEYVICSPTASIVREAKFRYSKAFTDALKSGLYTRKKLESILEDQEPEVLKKHTEKRASLMKQYYDVEREASDSVNTEYLEIQLGLLKLIRDRLIGEDISINNLFSNAAEQAAEDARVNFLTFSLVKYKGTDVETVDIWRDFEDFMEDPQFELVEHCKYQVFCWDFKIDLNFEENESEKKIREKVDELKKKQQEVEDAKAKEDLDLVKSEVEVSVPPVKKRRKKKAALAE